MSNLEKYIIHDNKTQYDKDWGYTEDMLYEIYGVNECGELFERDLVNQDRILRHASNGLKTIDMLFKDEGFFRKNRKGSHFFASYTNYDDYEYSKESKKLDGNEIINVLKEFIYLHSPRIGSCTCMGWNRKDGKDSPIYDPNYCHNQIQLDDKKDYTIIKRYDTVKLYEGCVGKFVYDDQEPFLSFKLDGELYIKALELSGLRRQIATGIYGKFDDNKLTHYIELKELIENKLKE